MSQSETVLNQFTIDTVQRLSELKQEPQWVREQRLAAFEQYENMDPPEWRRTRLRGFELDALTPFVGPEQLVPPQIEADLDHFSQGAEPLISAALVQTDSGVSTRRELVSLPDGVIFTDLDTAVREHPDLVRENFLKSGIIERGERFEALHAAFWSGGTFIYVPRGKDVALPLHSFFYRQRPALGLFEHNLIVVEEQSRLRYVQEYASAEAGYGFHNGMTEVQIARGSTVEMVQVQDWNHESFDVSYGRSTVDRDAHFQSVYGYFGGKNVRIHQSNHLRDIGAELTNATLFFGRGSGKKHLTVDTYHDAENTNAEIVAKGALTDEAESVFKGLIRIEEGAQKSNGDLDEETLLLNSDARSDAIPSLEIEANDVRATHGASAGEVDEEQVFYLRSRGFSYEQAKEIIVRGFFEPILEEITLDYERERIEGILNREIRTKSVIGTGDEALVDA